MLTDCITVGNKFGCVAANDIGSSDASDVFGFEDEVPCVPVPCVPTAIIKIYY